MLHNIEVSFGGRIAEELIFGDVTTGASQDIKQATNLPVPWLCSTVCRKRSAYCYGGDEDEVFIGRDLAHTRSYGEETASLIDEEVKRIIDESYAHAKKTSSKSTWMFCIPVPHFLWKRKKSGREEFESLFVENA